MFNLIDLPARILKPEYQSLPPNHLRIRVGVGNMLFFNQSHHLSVGQRFWENCVDRYNFKSHSYVIDIGCGCGRLALHLQNNNPIPFAGRYVGVDIDEEAIAWCRSNFDKRFRFYNAEGRSTSYNKYSRSSLYCIPEPEGVADIVFSTSLFSHLLEAEARHYLNESYRLLKVGGFIHHTFFLKNNFTESKGRHTFMFRHGTAYVESEKQLEAAVAYSLDDINKMATEAGFDIVEIHNDGQLQSFLTAQKL